MHYEERCFWDGVHISNTPVREPVQAHRDFWHKEKGAEVPDLEIYVVNPCPNIENSQSKSLGDLDLIQDREMDIKFSVKTMGDLQMASTITDYVDSEQFD
jgi:NTE family protein